MPRISFTAQLRRHVDCPDESVAGTTVRDTLEAYFARHPAVRGYVLDEQDALRRHVVVFVDGVQAKDRARLLDPVGPASELHVLQALSGG